MQTASQDSVENNERGFSSLVIDDDASSVKSFSSVSQSIYFPDVRGDWRAFRLAVGWSSQGRSETRMERSLLEMRS